MKFSYNWIQELVPALKATPTETMRQITLRTAEAEGLEPVGQHFGKVVSAKVVDVQPIEGSTNRRVVVKSAASDHPSNVSVRYAIIHTEPGAPGVGFQYEPLRGAIPLIGAGVRVAAPAPPQAETTCTTAGPNTPSRCTPASGLDLGATWLVVTVTRLKPGPWSVSHVSVHYRSWLRNRTATSSMIASSDSVGPLNAP